MANDFADTDFDFANVEDFGNTVFAELPPPSAPATPGKVQIDLGIDDLPKHNELCWQAIAQGNEPPVLFRFAGGLVRVATDENGRPVPQPLTADILRHHLSQWADWFKDMPANPKKPSLDVVKDVLATAEPALPPLHRIVTAPVFAPDGSLRLTPGYHRAAKTLYAPTGDFVALPVPEFLTAEDVDEATALICKELICDFPFAKGNSGQADRDNAVSLFLLPFARDLIQGATPCHLVEASMARSGKSKLVDALLYAALGQTTPVLTLDKQEDETRKNITTALMAGKVAVKMDNVNHFVNSAVLASALTETLWDDRVLGSNRSANATIRTIWTMTANNPQMTNEISQRQIPIRLEPQTANPEERSDFRHPSLLTWCAEQRATLVRAAHIIIKWWLQNGSPSPTGLAAWGGYEEYTRVIGGIMHLAGFRDFLKNRRRLNQTANSEKQIAAAFCAQWYEWANEPGYERERGRTKPSALLSIAQGIDGFPLYGANDRAQQISLGKWLVSKVDAWIPWTDPDDPAQSATFCVQRAGMLNGSACWRIQKLTE